MSNKNFPNTPYKKQHLFKITKGQDFENSIIKNQNNTYIFNPPKSHSQLIKEPLNFTFPKQDSLINPNKKKNIILRQSDVTESYLIKEYIQYAKALSNSSPNYSLEKKGFKEYKNNFPEWDIYEYILIVAVCELNDNFSFFNNYINLYLYENLKKLREQKVSKDFLSRTVQTIENTNLKGECFEFYNYKSNEIKSITGKEICIREFESLLSATALIYQKIKDNEELDLTQYYINGEFIQPVISAIKFNDRIERLFLGNNPIGEEGCYWLGTMLRNNKKLIELDLSYCKITNHSLYMIIKGLKVEENKNSNLTSSLYLKKINLSGNEITENGGEEIAILLQYFRYLKWLNICKNKLKNYGFKTILYKYNELIEQDKTNLETLLLYNNLIRNEDSLELLGKVVANPKCTLKSLVLSDNDIGSDEGGYLKYFFNSMKENQSLIELLMLNCRLGNGNVDDIIGMLSENKKLEKLCLYNNQIQDPKQFMRLLSIFSSSQPVNSTLKEFDLSKNKCNIEITDNFLNIIKNLQIQSLDISQNFELEQNSRAEQFKQVATDVQNKIKIIY